MKEIEKKEILLPSERMFFNIKYEGNKYAFVSWFLVYDFLSFDKTWKHLQKWIDSNKDVFNNSLQIKVKFSLNGHSYRLRNVKQHKKPTNSSRFLMGRETITEELVKLEVVGHYLGYNKEDLDDINYEVVTIL
jgi:hypothetical protein